MSRILRVIAKDQKQFDRFKNASKLYEKDVIVYRVTKPQQIELIHSDLKKVVVLPKGFDCMKAYEEKELRNKAAKLHVSFYSLTEKKFKEFESGPAIPHVDITEALDGVEGGDLVDTCRSA